MERKYRERLLKLAKHLESGKLGHKNFDFTVINAGMTQPNLCGTNGCACGELPIVFPKTFEFYQEGEVNLKDGSLGDWEMDVRKFFDIQDDELNHLFIPNCQDTKRYCGNALGNKATPKEVAKNIREFVKAKRLYREECYV